MKTKILLLPFALFFIIAWLPIALADLNYPTIGTSEYDYNAGDGKFNEQNNLIRQNGLVALSNPVMTPLVDDINGNGVNEIIVWEGGTISVYRRVNNDFSLLDSLAVAGHTIDITNNQFGYMILFDIDNNGRKDIIVTSDESGQIDIVDFKADNTLDHKKTLSLDTDFHKPSAISPERGAGQIKLACRATDDCIAIYSGHDNAVVGNNFTVQPFKKDAIGNAKVLGDRSVDRMFCMPRTSGVTVADYDGDGITEYIFAYSAHSSPSRMVVNYGTVTYPDFNLEMTVNESGIATTGGAPSEHCYNDFDIAGSMTIGEIKGGTSQLETILAIQSGNTFRMHTYNAAGQKINQYPSLQSAEGQLISNPIIMNAFGDQGKDFCVLGYKEQTSIGSVIDLLCGTETSTLFSVFGIFNVSSEEFITPIDGLYNLTRNDGYRYSSIVHAGDHTQVINQDIGANTDEITTPYGVYRLEFDEFNFLTFLPGVNDQSNLVQEWQNLNLIEGSLIPVDAERTRPKDPLNDFLYMTDTNLYYYNDGISNTNGQISKYTINPCIDAVWKLDTDVEVTVTVEDVDGDDVRASSLLYFDEGATEQLQNQTNYFANGTTFSFSFTADTLTAGSVLRMHGDDNGQNTSIDTIDLSFTVADNGVEKGDCITTKEIDVLPALIGEEEVLAPGTLDEDDNAIRNAVVAGADKLGVGTAIIWLIIMIAVTIGMFQVDMFKSIFGLVAILVVNMFMLVIGTILGFISVAVIISLVILASALVSVFLWRTLTGGN